MTVRSMAYDHPTYLAHHTHQYDAQVAGASKAYGKFLAYTDLKVLTINVTTITAGTSTYTAWNGTATVTTTGTGDTIAGIKVSGTTTSTYGPYALDSAAAGYRKIQISGTGAGAPAADGGVSLAAGDTFHVVRGTDATAVQVPCIEYVFSPGGNIAV